MDELQKMFEKAFYECAQSGYPQQVELETSKGKFVIVVAKLQLEEADEK